MRGNKAFISITALLIMGIILISSVFLLYISKLEYLILNSNKNSIQSYYLGEGKIYKVLYQDKYYFDEVLPRIETYLKYGALGKYYSPRIKLEYEDLVDGDNYRNIDTSFIVEENRRLMVLDTKSNFNGIDKAIQAKVNIIKDFYEMGIPILYNASIDEERLDEYLAYIDYISEEIKLPIQNSDIIGIESIDFDNIFIYKDFPRGDCIEFYRNNMEGPIMKKYLTNNLFLIIRENANLFIGIGEEDIFSEEEDTLILKGIVYTEGDIFLNRSLEFYGIMILNSGYIHISPNSTLKLEGIVLSKDYPFGKLEDENRAEINYNILEIKPSGIYLPDFIETRIKLIKGVI